MKRRLFALLTAVALVATTAVPVLAHSPGQEKACAQAASLISSPDFQNMPAEC